MPEPIRLFASDLDGTLLGNPATMAQFNRRWPGKKRPLLVYNTGRTLTDVQRRVAAGELAAPDFVISMVGTQIYDCQARRGLDAYVRQQSSGWQVEAVENCVRRVLPRAELQPAQFQSSLKSSWYVDACETADLASIEEYLKQAGQPSQVIYSNNRDLDVIPQNVGKGAALAWLCEHLGIPLAQVLVSGDRANDASMYCLAGVRGIMVDNAQPDLAKETIGLHVYHSGFSHAAGVLDGLVHFGVLAAEDDASRSAADADSLHLCDHTTLDRDLDADEIAFIQEAYLHGIIALKKNITPLGFSAASLADNKVTGTDANYRSVWGRDGAITLIHALQVDDEELQTACRQTLVTLLTHTTAHGQVPANVRIEDGVPDYSGVGGICAIDSAIWVVIAFYHYVQETDDESLIEPYWPTLQAIMLWLRAHDSNLDGLLEIPEASDWTDLFGRSYNVLYDEVLWYRANFCMGLLCERLHHPQQAVEYLQQAQLIRGRILHIFWPTTMRADDKLPSFADKQFGLGDARYLIAEVSPFNFSWRCDVFGNVLASLLNVIDAPRAQRALAFMWGSGVNQPWPVANLYPVVQAGDPDWRPYYTVNLLNLPHHYHNGGIWPLVGGMWVQFAYRLGQERLARRELYRLAQCCRQGKSFDWEFNEWYHGLTGRPMGQCFQAWSAATFVGACLELRLDGSGRQG